MADFAGAVDLTKQSEQFITQYAPKGFDVYDASTPVSGRIPKSFNHVGDYFKATVNLSMGGGRGFGTLPYPSNWLAKRVAFARKKMYYRGRLDREALYASKDGGATEDLYSQLAHRGPESFRNLIEYAMFAPYATNGSNAVVGSGQIMTVSAVSDADPTFTLTCANDFNAAFIEVGDGVNIGTGNSGLFEVTSITPSSTQVVVKRVTGSDIPAVSDVIFFQNSEDLAPLGLASICDFVAGDTLYGVAHQYRFAPTRVNCGGNLSIAKIEETILEMGDLTGQGPTDIYLNKAEWPDLTALLEGDKRYDVTMPRRKIEGHMGFKGLVFVHPYGISICHLSRFCPAGRMYFVNANHWELKHSRGFGWFRDSGSVFLTRPDDDELEVRFGGYGEFYAIPTYHGVLYGIT